MAVVSRNLSVTKSAYVKASTPYAHYNTNASTAYLLSGNHSANDANYLLFGLSSWPSSLKRNKLYCIRIRIYVRLADGTPRVYSIGDFNAGSVTFANMPTPGEFVADFYTYPYTQEWSERFKPTDVDTDSSTRAERAHYLLNGKGFAVTCNQSNAYESMCWYMKPALANGSAMYVEVTYDDTVKVLSKISYASAPSGTVNSRAAQTFSWRYAAASSDRCYDENWTQASAVLHWKTSAESSYHNISISGSSLSYTVPAGTFPAGSTIQWYVTGTDTDGTTTSTSVASFTTAAPGILITSCPSGNNYDSRKNSIFAWTYGTSYGEIPQAQANLFWRETGGSWHTVSVTGNTKTLTVPGNTFPTGKTIEWYMTVTGTDGSAASMQQPGSFTTASSAIQATIYPSGKDVESGQPLNFAWVFRNDLGDYEQQSASLFWRASTSDPFQEIRASGSTRGLTVPKNTFPGNASTVTWYLVGTDIGGTESQTREQTFTTVKSQITPQDSPTSGYKDPRNAITFKWYFATPTASYDQASAVFHWRIKGDETWNDVAAAGSETSVTIPANTFPVNSEIEWYISGTDAGGCSSQSSTYTINTIAATSYAICLAPVGRVEDGTQAITFRWMVQNSDGTAPSRMLLWWKLPSESQSEWHQLLDTTEEIYEYTVPPETYDAGPVQWRVQAYNRDDIAGPVNEASFVVLRAPDAPQGLSATAVPMTTVSWQSTWQEAFEITIDGKIAAAEYGPATYSWQVPEPLADGVHQIRLRIQGAYGLWSNYAETSILVENVPAGTLDLAGTFGTDAELQISAEIEEDTEVQWYRDGKRIGRTVGKTAFTDRFALGLHRYHAEIWQADGNYTRSNTVTGTMRVRWPMIADASGGAWISLKLSEDSRREQSFSWSMETSATHIHGRTYPVMELSPYENLSGSYDGAFRTAEEAAAFEQLRGKVVVLKNPGGRVIVGGLVQLKGKDNLFYYTYSFNLQRSDGWEDFVDDKGN